MVVAPFSVVGPLPVLVTVIAATFKARLAGVVVNDPAVTASASAAPVTVNVTPETGVVPLGVVTVTDLTEGAAVIAQDAVTVVAVSGGYPGNYESGKEITGLQSDAIEGSIIFQSGTVAGDHTILTNGGRVLAVTSFGDNITEAAEQSNYMLEQVYFEDMYYRNDIGYEFH